jgi:hypothetical protein
MKLSNEEAYNIVYNYILLINNSQENVDYKKIYNYNIIEIFFMIGKYNLVELLKLLIKDKSILKSYENYNLLNYTMISATYYRKNDILEILKSEGYDIFDYETMVNNMIIHLNMLLINMTKL